MARIKGWGKVKNLSSSVVTRNAIGWKNNQNLLLINSSVIKGEGWILYYPLKKPMTFRHKGEAIKYANEFMRSHPNG